MLTTKIKKLLVANRSEIAIRVMRAASELGIRTVAIYAQEDRMSLHRFKADESYLVGPGKSPIAAYLDVGDILRIAREVGVDAIHPGYGFLSERPDFAQACNAAGIAFVGPSAEVMRILGNKVAAREAAVRAGVPVLPATTALPGALSGAQRAASEVGYPLMLKASWGGGGRGMRVVKSEAELATHLESARREALSAFGNDEVYLEKLIERAHHLEVQVLGDTHGNLVHLYERDCSVQRRHQKVVERAPAPYLDAKLRADLCDAALRLARSVGYVSAGTVEFLLDADSGRFYFIEVNPRIQVEHTVTEEVTGIDIVKAQIRITEGARIGSDNPDDSAGVPAQESIRLNGHALQCRVTTEDPENGFAPDYGRLVAYRSAAGFGVRLDGGTAYSGAVITPYFDSLLVKVTAWAPSAQEAVGRMNRALREFRIRGVSTNLQFLENVINHPTFKEGRCTTGFIDSTPELFMFIKRQDRATKLLRYIGEVTTLGHPDLRNRPRFVPTAERAAPPSRAGVEAIRSGSRTRMRAMGAEAFVADLYASHGDGQPVLVTDTTMRDAHQSLFATRMRTHDMLQIAPAYAERLPNLFSLECWGGATFDVALRFLKEDPWERLARLREAVPNILLQMLLRGSNAVGYANYPDNVVRFFVAQAARAGIDVFRIFDSLNWVENMRVAIDAVRESGAIAQAAICYTGDLFDPRRSKYNLAYYVRMAKQLEAAGAQMIAIKDMAGVARPRAVTALVQALRQEVGVPLQFHTHDTSGIAAASVLAAVEAGVHVLDAAMDSMSGLTSQPNLGSIVAALQGGPRAADLSLEDIGAVSRYWESVRRLYAPFESDIRSGTSDVYRHEMPGGQYTNLREQARAMGLADRWADVSQAYAEVNQIFGDIIKVTPTSKVVGDMALFMVANELTARQVADPSVPIAFPESVVQLFKGELGLPADGFPAALQTKVLNGAQPMTQRYGLLAPPENMDARRGELAEAIGVASRVVSDTQLASYLMYPQVYREFLEHRARYGDVSVLPTAVFFYGLPEQQEIAVDIEPGKSLAIRLQTATEVAEEGEYKLFFELNGQPRLVRIPKPGLDGKVGEALKADPAKPTHIGAPMPGMVITVSVQSGQRVEAGTAVATIEAMKMQTTIASPCGGTVTQMHTKPGRTVAAKDLLMEIEPDDVLVQGDGGS